MAQNGGIHLEIRGLRAAVEGRQILNGVDLAVSGGEVHAIMGPNGSGKSTLAHTLMGHPRYEVLGGQALLNGENLLELQPEERAQRGLFLAFQYPVEVPGVTVANVLRSALKNVRGQEVPFKEFRQKLLEKMRLLDMDEAMAGRYLNEGFSGGEKKRNEILQMSMLEPKVAVMDETDSGLDIDALKVVSHGVNVLRGPGIGIVVITHYARILRYLRPDFVHVMMDGRIVRSGGYELAESLEEKGYDWIREEVHAAQAGE
jgi:Fe-S cluster assembly ATP-binding protein